MIMNKYFPLIATNYFCWLSDDDIMQPTHLESIAGKLDQNSEWDIVFSWCDVVNQTDGNDWNLNMYLGRYGIQSTKSTNVLVRWWTIRSNKTILQRPQRLAISN